MSFQQTAGSAVVFGSSISPSIRLTAGALAGGILIGAAFAPQAQAEVRTPDRHLVKAPGSAADEDEAASRAKAKRVPEPKSAARSLATARSSDWTLCRRAASDMGSRISAPKHLLGAVALTETGRRGPDGKGLMAWPWTINVQGKGYVFTTKAQAVRAVRRLLSQGFRSIDVGCVQVNLKYHPRAFTSLEEAFDPAANLAYGADFLSRLKERHGSWDLAVQHYHSYTEEHRKKYAARFRKLWALERRTAKAARTGKGKHAAAVANGARTPKTGLLARLPEFPRAVILSALPNLEPLRQLRPVSALMKFGVNLAALERTPGAGRRILQRLTGNYPEVADARSRSAALDEPASVN